ncbi:MAG: UDP-3-O-[3-hydroxymyristoyl] N-acetylglucosamine deacetylase [Phycisphaeraceae bacterium]|nr:UDP-3-O-[3-hydroxymyristoyl] N-acetylglucosamine deacetylase [Phycisphaeraceae bacterium]
MELQNTIAKSTSLSGRGLFTGTPATVTFRPAPVNHGVIFIRTDLGNTPVPALVNYVLKRARRTTLRNAAASIETCEHCLSAVAGLGIDNLIIEISGPELPGMDGSSLPYFNALKEAGLVISDVPRKYFVVTEPIIVQHDDAMVAAVPSDQPRMQAMYDLNYGDHPVIGRQLAVFDFNKGNYEKDIAPARTFVLESEATALREAGLGTHLTAMDVLVIDSHGPIGGNSFRFSNEPARHKVLDLIGDLSLLGAPIQGRIIAHKSGHWLNQALVRRMIRQYRGRDRHELALHREVLDVRKLIKILPHRYPMLLVDRVVEIDDDRRVLGIKNVTINEPFFQGHYPGTPIMPGVLIVEAMAQLSGVLMARHADYAGKLAVLLSLDRVKLRRPVTPGDQLMLEAEAVRIRSRTAHMRCRAYVAEELAAEAEVKFIVVDQEET